MKTPPQKFPHHTEVVKHHFGVKTPFLAALDISIIQYIVQRRRRIKIRHHKKVYLEAATPESRSYVMLWKTVTTVSRVTRLL